jgi:hypothetical protein
MGMTFGIPTTDFALLTTIAVLLFLIAAHVWRHG